MPVPVLRTAGAKAAAKETKEVEVGAPAGLEVGDYEVLIASTTTGTVASITSNGGGAWTPLGEPIDVAGGERLTAWTRERAEGDGNPKVKCTTSDHVCACRLAVKKGTYDTASPIEIVKSGTETTSDTSFAFKPETETAGPDRLCMVIVTSGVDSNTGQAGTNTANTSLTEVTNPLLEYQTAEGNGGGFWVATGRKETAGTVGEWTQTMVSASPKAYLSFAVAPATQRKTLSPATETDAAQKLSAQKLVPLTPASTSNTAVAQSVVKRLTLIPATEASVAPHSIAPVKVSGWTKAAIAISDMAVWWRLGSEGGNLDASGHGRDGSPTAGMTLGSKTGLVGDGDTATYFDTTHVLGLNGYTAMGNNEVERSIVIWGTGIPEEPGSGLLGGTEYTGFSSVFEFEGRDLNLHIGDPVTYTWTNAIPATGKWLLIITKNKEGLWNVNVNGEDKGSKGPNNPIVAGTQLGHGFWSWAYKGTLDEFIVYEHVLTSEEKASLLEAGSQKHTVNLTPATETDAAQKLSPTKRPTMTPATEADAAETLKLSKHPVLTPVVETDTALALHTQKRLTLTPATESDSSLARTLLKRLLFTTAAESDTAQKLAISKLKALTAATELDLAVGTRTVKRTSLTPATESDVALADHVLKLLTLSPSTESDSAVGIAVSELVKLIPALTVESAVPLTLLYSSLLTPATEADAAVGPHLKIYIPTFKADVPTSLILDPNLDVLALKRYVSIVNLSTEEFLLLLQNDQKGLLLELIKYSLVLNPNTTRLLLQQVNAKLDAPQLTRTLELDGS